MFSNFLKFTTKKTIIFGFAGSIGALLFALLVESLIYHLPKINQTKTKVDIIFVTDVTSSMSEEINGVKNGIKHFSSMFLNKNIDLHVGFVWFRDRFVDTNALGKITFHGQDTTDNYELFSNEVDKIIAEGGGDEPESAFDAVVLASTLKFRENTKKVLILITDAPPKSPDFSGKIIGDVKLFLTNNSIYQLHLAIYEQNIHYYQPLQEIAKGMIFPLQNISDGSLSFESAMPNIGLKIAEGLNTILSKNEKYDNNMKNNILLVLSIWWGAVALGTVFCLIIAQNIYLKQAVKLNKLLIGCSIGFTAGLGVGSVLLWFFENPSDFLKIMAWGGVGVTIGLVSRIVIPNYPSIRALLGGLFFVILANLLSDSISRLLGAAIVGFFVGLMFALFEEVLREAWLIVDWGNNDRRTISLGHTPVILGSSEEADVYLPSEKGFLPKTAIIKMENGKVWYENKINNRVIELTHGDKVEFVVLHIIVNIVGSVSSKK